MAQIWHDLTTVTAESSVGSSQKKVPAGFIDMIELGVTMCDDNAFSKPHCQFL